MTCKRDWSEGLPLGVTLLIVGVEVACAQGVESGLGGDAPGGGSTVSAAARGGTTAASGGAPGSGTTGTSGPKGGAPSGATAGTSASGRGGAQQAGGAAGVSPGTLGSGGVGGVAGRGGAGNAGGTAGRGASSQGSGGRAAASGGRNSGGAVASGRGGSTGGAASGTGGAPASGTSTPSSTCGIGCSTAPAGSCSSPQVRISEIDVGSTVQNNTNEAYLLPLAIAPMPGGGSRVAWMSGSTNYGSSTSSQVHIAQLDCEDQLVGTPVTMEAHDFQDLAADENGGVIVLTRDAQGSGAQHCGDVNKLCVLPSDRPGCYDMYMVRYDCAGAEQWATKLTSSNEASPPYTSGSGNNYSVWWYQHHGRLAYDGTNYAAYFCDAITVANGSCVDIHQGDRMQVVGPSGSIVSGHDSFALGCSHSGFTRIVWDPSTSHFVMVCKTDNNNRIAQPNPYRTILPVTLDGSFVGDIVIAKDGGYWVTVSNGGAVHLLHFKNGQQADQNINLAAANYPHLAALGANLMVAAWATGVSSQMTAQVLDRATGAKVGDTFAVAVPGNPYQSYKSFPDGSVAYAAPGTSNTKLRIARILPCTE